MRCISILLHVHTPYNFRQSTTMASHHHQLWSRHEYRLPKYSFISTPTCWRSNEQCRWEHFRQHPGDYTEGRGAPFAEGRTILKPQTHTGYRDGLGALGYLARQHTTSGMFADFPLTNPPAWLQQPDLIIFPGNSTSPIVKIATTMEELVHVVLLCLFMRYESP
jgi:hypothetical protein